MGKQTSKTMAVSDWMQTGKDVASWPRQITHLLCVETEYMQP